MPPKQSPINPDPTERAGGITSPINSRKYVSRKAPLVALWEMEEDSFIDSANLRSLETNI